MVLVSAVLWGGMSESRATMLFLFGGGPRLSRVPPEKLPLDDCCLVEDLGELRFELVRHERTTLQASWQGESRLHTTLKELPAKTE